MLPNSLYRAVCELEQDDWLRQYIGEELVDLYTTLKRKEIADYKKFVTDWEWQTYAYHI